MTLTAVLQLIAVLTPIADTKEGEKEKGEKILDTGGGLIIIGN